MGTYTHRDHTEVVVDGGTRDRELRAAGARPDGDPATLLLHQLVALADDEHDDGEQDDDPEV